MDASNDKWEKFFAWKRVSTPGYIKETAWLETVLRRRNPLTGDWEYRRNETPEEEQGRLVDFMAW